ncbi:PadR family transcriptional regulator [Amycolatopsis alba]|uniref:PadR family transcriptional regulator n=1 Tax=Amycolatopsis alba TaxID=76020 RepID=UPI000584E35C|nr:PadR family transcriptional regulator [Amycolatopsis alba]
MTSRSRAARTPLVLAVLSLLNEAPRHPYEMQSLIRQRRIGDVVRMRGGSLYDAVVRLEKLGLAEVAGTSRDGARPERTVYGITEKGRAELRSLLSEYLGERADEYPVFPAALAHAHQLGRAEAGGLLRERAAELAVLIDKVEEDLRSAREAAVPRAVLLETEYAQVLRRAELGWLRGVLADLETGDLEWVELEWVELEEA